MPADHPRQLLHEATDGPVAPLDHAQLRRRAHHRTSARRLSAAVLVLVVVAGAGLIVADLVGHPTIDIAENPSASVNPDAALPGLPAFPAMLELPPAGEVAAEHLGERPVFVVHRDDGEVLVVDAISPDPGSYTEHPKVLAFCRQPWTFRTPDERTIVDTTGTFDDLWHGSRFALDGTWLGGPAPTGVPRYEVLSVDADTVEIGPPGPAPGREVGPFQNRLGPEIHARPIADSTTDCTTEFDQTRSESQPADSARILWHRLEHTDRWAYPFASDGEQASAQDPVADREQPTTQEPARPVPPLEAILIVLVLIAVTAAVSVYRRRRRN